MREQLFGVLTDFLEVPGFDEAGDWVAVKADFSDNGHEQPRKLVGGERGIYAFFQGNTWLRIGQTGYPERFRGQHYGTNRANSTFAKDIWANREEFGYTSPEEEIGRWILTTFGRANVILPAAWPPAISPLLEAYLHHRLRPRFEGRR